MFDYFLTFVEFVFQYLYWWLCFIFISKDLFVPVHLKDELVFQIYNKDILQCLLTSQDGGLEQKLLVKEVFTGSPQRIR